MEQNLKAFEDLSTTELYKILKLRSEVFVVEQTCAYQDIDGKDMESMHFWLEDEGEILAYCRLLPRGLFYEEAAIGRVIVRESARGAGLARKMLMKVIEILHFIWKEPELRIEAQYYLRKFYASCGFVEDSEPFFEDGIKHVEMLLRFD